MVQHPKYWDHNLPTHKVHFVPLTQDGNPDEWQYVVDSMLGASASYEVRLRPSARAF